MSSVNVEIVRRGQEAFNEGDLGPVKSHFSPEIEWGAVGAFPGLAAVYHSHDGVDEWMDTVRAAFASFHVTIERVVRDGDDVVIVVEHLRGTGRESQAEVEMRIFTAYWFADGKIIRRRAFTDESDALAAAGG